MTYEKDQLGPYQKRYLEHWEQFLDSNTAVLQKSFNEIIQRFKKAKPSSLKKLLLSPLKGKKTGLAKIEFWHDAWELDLYVEFLDVEESPIENDLSKRYLFNKYSEYSKRADYQLSYPPDCDVYLEESREVVLDGEKYHRFFCWLVKNWMACGGHHINVLTTTEENSVRRVFNLNYINWFENIEYLEAYNAPSVPYPLRRDLTDYEIAARVGMENILPFTTYWRYLEKGEQFIEFAFYDFQVYQRKGKKSQFQELSFTLMDWERKDMCQQIDHHLNQGFYEVPRPAEGPPIHEHLVEWHCPAYRKKPHVSKQEWRELENKISFTLPGTYKWFLTRMDKQERLSGLSHFRVGFENWRPIIGLVKLEDWVNELISLHKTHKLNPTLFPVAKGEGEVRILMDHQSEGIFLLDQQGEVSKLHDNLQDFLGNSCEISEYFCPKRVHLEKENAMIIREWISQGWDMSDVKTLGSRSVMQVSSSDEINLLLLENGADPNELYIFGDRISRPFLDQLITHGFDLKKKFEMDKRLKRDLEKRGEFDDLIERFG